MLLVLLYLSSTFDSVFKTAVAWSLKDKSKVRGDF